MPFMSPSSKKVLAKLEQIEAEMKRIGLWQSEPLEPEKYEFQSAFAMDTMAFSQWLQFVFLPRVQEGAAQESFPSESYVAVQAMREFDGMTEATQLVTLLTKFDALFGENGEP
jgi:uncharacterized protein YqcC (DUF446 family)